MTRHALVLDTNIVLDLFVFVDDAAHALRAGLVQRQVRWLATSAMRDELVRVLGYPQIAARLAARELQAQQVLDEFDRHAEVVDAPGKAPITCGDADDQKFIDLAISHGACILSKDFEVLRMKKRLQALAADAMANWTAPLSADHHELA